MLLVVQKIRLGAFQYYMTLCTYVLLTAARAIPSYTRQNGAALRECIEYGIAQSRSQ